MWQKEVPHRVRGLGGVGHAWHDACTGDARLMWRGTMRGLTWSIAGTVWLSFTLTPHARAQSAHLGQTAAPHNTVGPALTFGSIVGFTEYRGAPATTVGWFASVGHRFHRLTIESQLDVAAMREYRNFEADYDGRLIRLGVHARWDVFRMTRRFADANSMLAIAAQAGVGRQRATWISGDTFARTDTMIGAIMLIDHRFQKPLGFPSRVGFHLGWRVFATPPTKHRPTLFAPCKKNGGCMPAEPVSRVDLGLLVSAGLMFTW